MTVAVGHRSLELTYLNPPPFLINTITIIGIVWKLITMQLKFPAESREGRFLTVCTKSTKAE